MGQCYVRIIVEQIQFLVYGIGAYSQDYCGYIDHCDDEPTERDQLAGIREAPTTNVHAVREIYDYFLVKIKLFLMKKKLITIPAIESISDDLM